MLCDICKEVDFLSILCTENAFGRSNRIEWDFEHVQRSQDCPFCRLLLHLLLKEGLDPANPQNNTLKCYVMPDYFGAYRHAKAPEIEHQFCRLVLSWADHNWISSHTCERGIQLLRDERHSTLLTDPDIPLFQGRSCDQESVNIPLIRQWLTLCQDHHETTCGLPGVQTGTPWSFPLRVIDVDRHCIVDAPAGCRYVALSYVWGSVNQLRLTKKTKPGLMSNNGLSHHRLLSTIQDAIDFTRTLGEKFIWIDSLCIVQDDDADKNAQIKSMDKIYNLATLTIVAAAGNDADAGLPGSRLKSRSPDPRLIETVNGVTMMITTRPFVDAIVDATWESRGWTFQEKMLSRRLLLFTEDQVFFHCNLATWVEDTVLENVNPDIEMQMPWYGHRELFKPRPSSTRFEQYGTLVEGYVGRNLTNEADILFAFAGVLGFLEPSFPGGFIWGLPVCYFDAAFLWGDNYELKERRTGFPSWSWLGWKGKYLHIPGHLLTQTIPGVAWHTIEVSKTGTSVQIKEIQNSEIPYSSDDIPWKPLDTETRVCIDQIPNHLKKILTSQHLIFWTSTAFLAVNRPSTQETEKKYTEHLILIPSNNSSSNSSDNIQVAKIHLDKHWRAVQPDNLKFIVISRYIAPSGKNSKPDHSNSMLNLMLVEEKHGISCRVQLVTAVKAESWMMADPKWELVILE